MSGVAAVVVAALLSQTVTLDLREAERINVQLRTCAAQERGIESLIKAGAEVNEANSRLAIANRDLREANQALILSQEGGTPWKPIAIVSLALSVVLGGLVVKSAIDAGKKNP